jgi:hypothetical protein
VTSFAKHPGFMVIHSFQKKNLMWQSIHSSTRHVSLCHGFCLDFVLDSPAFVYDGGQLKSLCIHLILSRIWCGSCF